LMGPDILISTKYNNSINIKYIKYSHKCIFTAQNTIIKSILAILNSIIKIVIT